MMAPLFNWPFTGLLPRSYGLIYADPPWLYEGYSERGNGKNPARHYACMPLDEIKALPVSDLADPDGCACVMWATAPLLPAAIATLEAWGFAYSSAGAWAKMSARGGMAFGTGYRYRTAAEFFLLGTRGKPRQTSRSIRNLIIAPTREHSRKPDQMYVDLEAQWPGPRVELFARTRRPGWDSWGTEVDRFPPARSEAA